MSPTPSGSKTFAAPSVSWSPSRMLWKLPSRKDPGRILRLGWLCWRPEVVSKWLKLMCLFVTLCMSVCVEPFLGWFLEEGPRAIIWINFYELDPPKGCIEHHWVLQVELDPPSDLWIKSVAASIRRFGMLQWNICGWNAQVIRIREMLWSKSMPRKLLPVTPGSLSSSWNQTWKNSIFWNMFYHFQIILIWCFMMFWHISLLL